MKREDILAMPPGRNLDSWVAEKVMGWHRVDMVPQNNGWFWSNGTEHTAWDSFSPSTDISAAWKIVEKLTQEYRITLYKLPGGKWSCKFSDFPQVIESDAPEAIAKAALLTVLEDPR